MQLKIQKSDITRQIEDKFNTPQNVYQLVISMVLSDYIPIGFNPHPKNQSVPVFWGEYKDQSFMLVDLLSYKYNLEIWAENERILAIDPLMTVAECWEIMNTFSLSARWVEKDTECHLDIGKLRIASLCYFGGRSPDWRSYWQLKLFAKSWEEDRSSFENLATGKQYLKDLLLLSIPDLKQPTGDN